LALEAYQNRGIRPVGEKPVKMKAPWCVASFMKSR